MKIKCMKIFLFGLALLFSLTNLSFAEEDVQALKNEIKELRERIDHLESSQEQSNKNRNANVQRWDPFAEMHRMQEAMDEMFQSSFTNPGLQGSGIFSNSFSLDGDLELKESEDGYEVHFDLTGLDKDKVNIEVNEHSITVKGEQSRLDQEENTNGFFKSQSFGTFMKTIPLPIDADTSKVKTDKEGEKLVIRLPKKNS